MVSEPCNYYLEKIVAQKLSENENKYMKFPKVVKHFIARKLHVYGKGKFYLMKITKI